MRTPITTSLILLTLCLVHAWADAPAPPPREQLRDSVAVRWEEGAELTRWLASARWDHIAAARMRTALKADWTTALSRGLSTDGRLRHDVRWSGAVARALNSSWSLWGGATGQHYVDRPRATTTVAQENRSHLLRLGAGPAVRWSDELRSAHSLGMVADSRVERTESGLATWHTGEYALNSAPEVRHRFEALLDYESPGARSGSAAELQYALNQEYEAARNSADVSFNWTRRDVLTAINAPSQLREETALRIADAIEYELGTGAALRGHGDVRYFDTKLDDRRGNNSRLEELESGIESEFELRRRRSSATLSLAVRGVSQNVRGEILTGRKTVLAADGRTKVHTFDVRLHSAFSKYTLDTRSDENFDDRDELAWRFDGGLSAPVNRALKIQIQALADLNHLVYIFSSNSANNRWTRLFLLTTRFVHTPDRNILHAPEFRISANYQAYDFELNPRQVRSTVFRRITLGDSVAVRAERWVFALRAEVAREELGRLYWDDFAEERSDRTDVLNAAFISTREFSPGANISAGAVYGVRRGDRFEFGGAPLRVQDIVSWGPLARVNWNSAEWFFTGGMQWVLQSELGRADRDFLSGTITAGRTW